METIRLFTLFNEEVIENIEVSGHSLPIISLGESNWHNGYNFIPVMLPNDFRNYWELNNKVYIRLARIKKNKLFASNGNISLRNRAIILFKNENSNGYEFTYKGEAKKNGENLSFPGLIIASGYKGHMHNFNFYKSKEMLSLMPSFQVFSLVISKEGKKIAVKYFMFNGQKIEEIKNGQKKVFLSAKPIS